MRLNRSVPPCAVIPVLIYPDPTAAADWLSKAFGFTVRLRIANHRIQMKAGEGCFTIAEGSASPNTPHIVQVRIEGGKCQGEPVLGWLSTGEKVPRERRWTSAGATPARELVRSTR